MTLAPRNPFANPLAVEWDARLQQLRLLIQREETDPSTWLWGIQARILSYMLARYGLEPGLGRCRLEMAGTYEPTPPLISEPAGKPPRSGRVLHEYLVRIAEQNRIARVN